MKMIRERLDTNLYLFNGTVYLEKSKGRKIVAKRKAPYQGSAAVNQFGRPTRQLIKWRDEQIHAINSGAFDQVTRTRSESYISIQDLIETYNKIAEIEFSRSGEPKPVTVGNAIKSLRLFCRKLGISLDSPLSVITPEQILNFVSLYENKITGWGYISQTKCLFSSWAKTYYEGYGISLPNIVWPRPKRNPSKKYKRPCNELRQATIQWYKDLETKNPQQWCMVTMAIQFGMRWGDVERSKMEWFNDGYLDYAPKKTEGRTNAPRSVRWPHSEDLIKRLKKALNGQSHISGDRCAKDREDDHKQIIQEMRQIGWQEFRAPFHELRKLCVDAIYRAGGLEKAVQISGDNAQTVIAFYSDPRLENVKPVDITDLI